MIRKHIDGWHFARSDMKLGYRDGRLIVPGETIRIEGSPQLCSHGLHASRRILDALDHAPGPVVCRVRLSGEIIAGGNKMVGTERTVLWHVEPERSAEILYLFARRCALDVLHLWDPPPIVVEYLKTGDESKRDAARVAADVAADVAAWGATWGTARVAAWAAAWGATRDAAWAAAWAAAGASAWDAAGDAAWAAAGDAARDAQNKRLHRMLMECLRTAHSNEKVI